MSFQSCVAAAQNEVGWSELTSIFCTQYGNISDMNLDITFFFFSSEFCEVLGVWFHKLAPDDDDDDDEAQFSFSF